MNEKQIVNAIRGMVNAKFRGNYRAAFDHYDGNRDGKISQVEVEQLLADAHVALVLRPLVAARIMQTIGSGGYVTWTQLQAVLARN